MRISFITTVFNEEKNIEKFLRSLVSQTKQPDEIIIVDGGSTDNTLSVISNFKFQISNLQVKVLTKRGNRSVGRNEAIKKATGDIIVCSDSGNILDKKWIEKITQPFLDSRLRGNDKKRVDVVAGYYKGLAKNVFQKCLIPYVLVMPDNVDPDKFLPATRSIAFTKAIWKKVGGFDEKYSHNEDYVFAHKLKKVGARIVFAKDAIVNWIPRNSFKESFIMFFRFALGDAEAGIWRTNVLLVFARYFLGLYFIFLSVLYKSFFPLVIILVGFIFYSIWSIKKNYNYVKNKEAFTVLPLLQLTADSAVLYGTCLGFLKIIIQFNYFSYIKKNKFLFFILFIYVAVMLSILKWGIPNQFHPFPYNMDEWHQLQAVANTYRYGTPNTFGSANGTMFHFLLSGFYLIPFMLVKVVDPFALQIDNWFMRERVFEILRLQTILFGSLSIFALYKIAEILKVSRKLAISLFVFTPLWLAISNYFKYDIALLFWILLSTLFFLRFWKNPTNRNFILAAIPSALTLAVKVSAMPIVLIYAFSYFWFHPQWKKNLKVFFAGIGIFIFVLILFGLPDTVFGKGNIILYFWENVIQAPATSSNYNLGMHPLLYLFGRHYPMIFGHAFMYLFAGSVLLWMYLFIRDKGFKKIAYYKGELFIFFSLAIFVASLIPLQIFGAANRSLVVLPFMVLLIAFSMKRIMTISRLRVLFICLISLLFVMQISESYAMLYTKVKDVPRETSSIWVQKNIKKGELIGIENIPIYQPIPDVIQKEFYFNQYHIKQPNHFRYEVIDEKTKHLPKIVVIADDEMEKKFIKDSSKKRILNRLERENYKKIAIFSPDLTYYTFFNNVNDYYFYAWLTSSPLSVAVFVK